MPIKHPDYPDIDFKPAIARFDWDQTYNDVVNTIDGLRMFVFNSEISIIGSTIHSLNQFISSTDSKVYLTNLTHTKENEWDYTVNINRSLLFTQNCTGVVHNPNGGFMRVDDGVLFVAP